MEVTGNGVGIAAGITALVFFFTQFLKVLVIDKIVKSDDPSHDTLVRATTFLLSLILTCLATLSNFPAPGTGYIFLLVEALGFAGIPIGAYHTITNSSTTTGLLNRVGKAGAALSNQPDIENTLLARLDSLSVEVASLHKQLNTPIPDQTPPQTGSVTSPLPVK